jgi:hypothetical protein
MHSEIPLRGVYRSSSNAHVYDCFGASSKTAVSL